MKMRKKIVCYNFRL